MASRSLLLKSGVSAAGKNRLRTKRSVEEPRGFVAGRRVNGQKECHGEP